VSEFTAITAEFLGIPETDDPRLILGITTDRTDHIAINTALRRRLAQLHVHPSGHSQEANSVRDFLNQITTDLLLSSPEVSIGCDTPSTELTPLDQAIIAALICEGGWNKNSRSRLVGVAASFSITVGGLVRILEAFADAARSGSGPLSLQQRNTNPIDRTWATVPKKTSTFSIVDTFISETARKLTPELNTSNPIVTIKLAILFSLLTLIAFILSLQVLLSKEEPTIFQRPKINNTFPSIEVDTSAERVFSPFEVYPSFSVQDAERSMLESADRAIDQPRTLSEIASSIQISLAKGQVPSADIISNWNTSIDTLAYGSPFVEKQIQHASEVQIAQVLLESQLSPNFTKRLINTFQIPTIKNGSPSQISRAVWSAGLLATLSCDQRLSPELRIQLRTMQYPSIITCESDSAKTQALSIISKDLLETTEFDQRTLDMWETWFVVVKQLQQIAPTLFLQTELIDTILSTDIDLLRESNTRKLLGRVIQDTNWTSSLSARDRICELISDVNSNSIDVALLTALFNKCSTSTWYDTTVLVFPEFSLKDRIATATLLKEKWPIDSAAFATTWNLKIPIGFDIDQANTWLHQADALARLSTGGPKQLAKLRLLNEAAIALWKGRPDLADRPIEQSKSFELSTNTYFGPFRVAADNTFSSTYQAVGKDQFDQLGVIDSLLNSDTTDLGSTDADLLASISLTSLKSKLRNAATLVIVEQFKNGPTVALALLNHFHRAKTKEQISTLVAQLTNVILPDKSSSEWETIARKALVQHSLTAGNPYLWELDEISNEIATSYISEFQLLNPESIQLSSEVSPNIAIEMVVDTWKRRIPPSYLPTITNDFNPTGVLQEFLRYQLEYYSLLVAEEARWRSNTEVLNNNRELLRMIHTQQSIIKQLITVELEITKHWSRLLKEVIAEIDKRESAS